LGRIQPAGRLLTRPLAGLRYRDGCNPCIDRGPKSGALVRIGRSDGPKTMAVLISGGQFWLCGPSTTRVKFLIYSCSGGATLNLTFVVNRAPRRQSQSIKPLAIWGMMIAPSPTPAMGTRSARPGRSLTGRNSLCLGAAASGRYSPRPQARRARVHRRGLKELPIGRVLPNPAGWTTSTPITRPLVAPRRRDGGSRAAGPR
jgi:hypothetical protein